ncbi:MAG: hypothetical protein A2017_11080 [Lentisphaerae bacterium GWF2_44_16]|nr:MAG: hypothetical protein A2017_11080 [Lentisphaerae bacterium GWF2_44_16]
MKKNEKKKEPVIESSIIEFERISGLTITMHDLGRVFSDEEGNTLLGPRRQSHRRCPICLSSPREMCIEHCMNTINAEVESREDEFFFHSCHMGLTEIVVPLRQNGIHNATLFAGKWKSPARKKKFLLSKEGKLKYEKLETFKASSTKSVAKLLVILGKGFISETQQISDNIPTTRKAQILQLIRKRISKKISLKTLSDELHISPSRTCHFVREIFGISFSKLLNRERLQVAKNLLLSTDRPVSEIAAELGISSEFHFNRLFKKSFGIPPGKYRKAKDRLIEK